MQGVQQIEEHKQAQTVVFENIHTSHQVQVPALFAARGQKRLRWILASLKQTLHHEAQIDLKLGLLSDPTDVNERKFYYSVLLDHAIPEKGHILSDPTETEPDSGLGYLNVEHVVFISYNDKIVYDLQRSFPGLTEPSLGLLP